ncbi:MAG: ribonuclease HIII [Bacilli bacterium]|nr:ribonuclease HIII [Bacilli bacterium]
MGYTLNLDENQIKILQEKLKDYEASPTNNYTLFLAKFNTSTITIYKTKTVLIQGKTEYETYLNVCDMLSITPIEKERNQVNESAQILSYIGTDEVGTGDFFGGIVVAGAFVSKENIPFVKQLGVKDSKELSDFKILQIAPLLEEKIPYYSYTLDNLRFNYLTSHYKLNMNHIKSLLHNSVILNMKKIVSEYDGIIIDGFTTQANYFNYLKNEKNVAKDVILYEKAENKYLSVACASIIARYEFIKSLDELSKLVGFDIPKGAGKPVDAAIKRIYVEKGLGAFKNIAKINFKNLDPYRSL